ncbi:MAG: 3-methyl-2-oxobutanoate hydroxymethyltransferase [Bacteroidetes bacterium]|nr:3-methyl-2-oxobutanoate hydroxymethyltransferase [Bacteroidota bacterium]
MSTHNTFRRITTKSLYLLKQKGKKISALTAYDYLTAQILDQAGIDLILVGDSLGNVFQGNDTTLSVTLDEMIYHTKAVSRAVTRAMVVADMPFMTYQTSPNEAFRNAGRIMKETAAGGVKIEGGEIMAETVKKITENGIPVMAHIGLMPQSIHKFGGYAERGKTDEEALQIKKDALVLQEAGAFAVVVEKVPAGLAKEISESLDIPTIGIGGGAHCDGQILVTPDMLGLNVEFHPRFVRHYAKLAQTINAAVSSYINDVVKGQFPTEEESY